MKKEERGFRRLDKIILALCVIGIVLTLAYIINFLGFQTLVKSHYTVDQQFTFLAIVIILMFFAMVGFTIYNIVKMVKNEKEAKKFREEYIKVGDSVNFYGGQNFDAEVLEINGDKTKVSVEIFTSRLYPNKN